MAAIGFRVRFIIRRREVPTYTVSRGTLHPSSLLYLRPVIILLCRNQNHKHSLSTTQKVARPKKAVTICKTKQYTESQRRGSLWLFSPCAAKWPLCGRRETLPTKLPCVFVNAISNPYFCEGLHII